MMTKLVTAILDHLDRYEPWYKYLVFPVASIAIPLGLLILYAYILS